MKAYVKFEALGTDYEIPLKYGLSLNKGDYIQINDTLNGIVDYKCLFLDTNSLIIAAYHEE